MSIFKFKNTRYTIQNTNRGFTFVELIVVIAIFSIMAGVVIFNARDFGDGIALQNLAQDIAMQLKKAQNDGSSGKTDSCFFSGVIPTYGVYFSSPVDNDKFNYFADYSGDKKMRPGLVCGTKSESQKIFNIPNGNTISKLCVNRKNCNINDLHITFTRPNLNANIVSPQYVNNIIDDAEIEITSPKGKIKTIVIWPTGQISIE